MRPKSAPMSPPGKDVCTRNAAKFSRSSLRRVAENSRVAASPASLASSACSSQIARALRCRYSTSGSPSSSGCLPDSVVPLLPYTPTLKAASTAFSTSSETPFTARSGAITLRSTTLRERMASSAPSTAFSANSSSAMRQWRLRHCEDMRVRIVPPNGMRLARPLSSRFSSAAGYECRVWICRNLGVVIFSP